MSKRLSSWRPAWRDAARVAVNVPRSEPPGTLTYQGRTLTFGGLTLTYNPTTPL